MLAARTAWSVVVSCPAFLARSLAASAESSSATIPRGGAGASVSTESCTGRLGSTAWSLILVQTKAANPRTTTAATEATASQGRICANWVARPHLGHVVTKGPRGMTQ
jgi:hypothetical protein